MEDVVKMLRLIVEVTLMHYKEIPGASTYCGDVELLMNTVENLHEDTIKNHLAVVLGSFVVAGPSELMMLKLLMLHTTKLFMEQATKILGPNGSDLANLNPVGEA